MPKLKAIAPILEAAKQAAIDRALLRGSLNDDAERASDRRAAIESANRIIDRAYARARLEPD